MTAETAISEERRSPRITRVTTRVGDGGKTGLVGGQMVPKTDPRIEAYGAVDELSSVMGLVRTALRGDAAAFDPPADAELLDGHLVYLQNMLFTVGGDLATRIADRHPMMPVVTEKHIEHVETVCDAFNAGLPPLSDFVLPGGSATAAALHQARTVCRRAERRVCALAEVEDIGAHPAVFLNRLSDLLFVLSRWANARMGVEQPIWRRDLPAPELPGE